MYFHGARFSNYEAWLSDPIHIKPSAQVVWPVVGQEILNGDVGGGFQGIQITSGFFQLWRASGITSELQLYSTAIGGLVMAAAMFFAGWFHYHKAAPKLEWFQNVESMLNHHLAGLLGLGSLGWAGHQIHISLPVNKLLDAGVDPKEIPLPHDLILNRQIMADLYPSFSKGLAPFFTLQWNEYSDFLTFNGGLNPVTGGLWLSDTAHHHVAIAVLFLVAGHMYRTNWGIGHSMKEILEAHKGPFTGEGHVGLYEILTTSWHAQLAINLALFGSLSIIVAYPSMGHVKLFHMLEQPESIVRLLSTCTDLLFAFAFCFCYSLVLAFLTLGKSSPVLAMLTLFKKQSSGICQLQKQKAHVLFLKYVTSSPRKFFELFLGFFTENPRIVQRTVRWNNLDSGVNQQEIQQRLDSSETTRRGRFLTNVSDKWTNFSMGSYSWLQQGQLYWHLWKRSFPFLLSTNMHYWFQVYFANQNNNSSPTPYNFQGFYNSMPSHKTPQQVPPEFLEWFIGFTEGDGSFTYNGGKPMFVINQADLGLLHNIRTTLGFGFISTFTQDGSVYARYTVGSKDGVRCLIALFNGNIQFEKVQKRFENWVCTHNTVTSGNIKVLPKRKTTNINLSTAWLSGIFESEGSFHSHIKTWATKYRGTKTPPPNFQSKIQKRLYVRAYFDQQFELATLQHVASLFEIKNVYVRDSTKEHYRLELDSKPHLSMILDYFKKYPLKGRKADSYAIWKKIAVLYVNSTHLAVIDTLDKPIARLKAMYALFKKTKSVLTLLKLQLDQQGKP